MSCWWRGSRIFRSAFSAPIAIPPCCGKRIARAGGLEFVQDRCVKIEHARFFGGLNLVGMNTGVVTSRRHVG